MNKSIFFLLLVLILIITRFFLFKIQEHFTNNYTIILMGDSILENSNYVPEGKSVADLLQTKTNKLFNYAKDGATISDLYAQLDKIPIEFNDSNTNIFVSAGGNDILTKQHVNVDTLFNNYNSFLNALKAKLGYAKLNLLNLYLPSNPRYKSYASIVDKWNHLIDRNSSKLGATYNVVSLDTLLTSPNDFVYDIEPSETASVKISDAIYLTR